MWASTAAMARGGVVQVLGHDRGVTPEAEPDGGRGPGRPTSGPARPSGPRTRRAATEATIAAGVIDAAPPVLIALCPSQSHDYEHTFVAGRCHAERMG